MRIKVVELVEKGFRLVAGDNGIDKEIEGCIYATF